MAWRNDARFGIGRVQRLFLGTGNGEKGTEVTATAAELNIMDGVTATASEINGVADASARVVSTTATALSLTVASHADRVVLVNTNSTGACTLSLPAASGSGAKFTVINNIAQTQGSVVVIAQ